MHQDLKSALENINLTGLQKSLNSLNSLKPHTDNTWKQETDSNKTLTYWRRS